MTKKEFEIRDKNLIKIKLQRIMNSTTLEKYVFNMGIFDSAPS